MLNDYAVPYIDVFFNLIKAKSQSEVQGKRSEHILKKFLKKLEKYRSISEVFDENFPLYVILVVRMHR